MANTIEYADSPNVDTAFVVQEGGQKNRAVLTAPQDTTTLELPDNPNSTKGYVTVDGKKHKVILVADISGNGGGGGGAVDSVNGKTGVVVLDATDVGAVPQYETMPTADASNADLIVQFVGATDTYTNGYFYKNETTPVYSSTTEFNPASISGTTVTCSGADFANFVATWGSGNITDIIKGTLTYDQSGGLLVFVGQDDTDTQVCTFQLYTQDYEDAGFTFTGTLADGDVIAFTTTITETATYNWTRIDVQPQPVIPDPLPSQTGNNGKFLSTNGTTASWETVGGLPSQTGQSGKFLTTDGTDASWATINALQNTNTAQNNSIIIGDGGGYSIVNSDSIAICPDGYSGWIALGTNAVAIGSKSCDGTYGININGSGCSGNYAIQLGYLGSNPDDNTFKVANANGNFEMMDANGNLPADRIADTTGLTAGNYLPRLTIDAQGNKTITWVAE